MRNTCCLCVCVSVLVSTAEARLGETMRECQGRYGAVVTNFPGHGDLAGVSVFVKDGIYVTAFVSRIAGQGVRASMVLYSRHAPEDKLSLFKPQPNPFTAKELDTLLKTVAGRWESYDPPPQLTGTASRGKSVSIQPSITIRQRDAAAGAVKKALENLYDSGFDTWVGLPHTNIAHNGPRIFAFGFGQGRWLAIGTLEGTDSILAWTTRMNAIKEAPRQAPERKLSGF